MLVNFLSNFFFHKIGLLVFVAIMWGSEGFPFYATALLIPVLVVFLRILRDPNTKEVMPAKAAAQVYLGPVFRSTVI